MKIIFLDIDGVLTSLRTCTALDGGGMWTEFDPVGVAIIKRLCENHNYKIVISSTWRWGNVDKLHQQLEKHDLKKFLHKDWKTDLLNTNRGAEVQKWLNEHPGTEYLIFDDDSDFTDEQRRFHIHTDSMNGITDANIMDITKRLNGNTNIILTRI